MTPSKTPKKKICSVCETRKPLKYFDSVKRFSKSCYYSYCRSCAKKKQKKQNLKNKKIVKIKRDEGLSPVPDYF